MRWPWSRPVVYSCFCLDCYDALFEGDYLPSLDERAGHLAAHRETCRVRAAPTPPAAEPALSPAEAQKILVTPACRFCVPPETMIAAPVPRSIELLRNGDTVLCHDGGFYAVEQVVCHTFEGELIELRPRSALPLRVTPEHEILILPALKTGKHRTGWRWRQQLAPLGERAIWRRAADLQLGDYVLTPRTTRGAEQPPASWETVEQLWLLGLFVGDGSTHGRNGRAYYATLTLGTDKPWIIERALTALRARGLRPSVRIQHATVTQITVSSRAFAEELRLLIGTDSTRKQLPPFVWGDPRALRAALSGVLAADGDVTVHRGVQYQRLFTTSVSLAWQVWHAAISLGYQPYIEKIRRTSGYKNASPAWRVRWNLGDTQRQFIGVWGDYLALPLWQLRLIPYSGPVYDLSVAETHTFLANGVITHNCGGYHRQGACPRVRRMEGDFPAVGPAGTLRTVEFWRDGEWSTDGILWPEELSILATEPAPDPE